jgi:hypothetical protein
MNNGVNNNKRLFESKNGVLGSNPWGKYCEAS